ncbi:hypothetical protein HAX54_020045, partial [Datura stramonium]|nr:hypothetical protein [Datura stramonium]
MTRVSVFESFDVGVSFEELGTMTISHSLVRSGKKQMEYRFEKILASSQCHDPASHRHFTERVADGKDAPQCSTYHWWFIDGLRITSY